LALCLHRNASLRGERSDRRAAIVRLKFNQQMCAI
jgi:hypothetical protein